MAVKFRSVMSSSVGLSLVLLGWVWLWQSRCVTLGLVQFRFVRLRPVKFGYGSQVPLRYVPFRSVEFGYGSQVVSGFVPLSWVKFS